VRIVLFSDTYPPQINGVATATFTLAKVLSEKGNKVLVVTTALPEDKKIKVIDNVVRIPGVTFKKLYNYKFAGFFSKRVFRIVRSFKPDIIHIQTEAGIGIFGRLTSFQLNVPLVYTYHTMYEDYTYYVTKGVKPFDFLAKKAVAFLSAQITDSTTAFTTTSDKTKEALRRYGAKKYINVIPNGLDLSSFARSRCQEGKLKEISAKYNLAGKFVILILGRLAKEKANEVVIDFFASYLSKTKDKDSLLLVVGDGPDKENLMKKTESLNLDKRVIFTGAVDHTEAPYFYNSASVYVSASTSETQGLTYIEAMAAKRIVLARFDDNLVGTVKDGQTGFFFTDEESFVQKLSQIKDMSEEEKEKIGEQAYENTSEQFGLDKYYQRMMNVYEKAVRKYW
jgi:1,2-diacylglycerol 3-alpha-glucosyltransferase